MGLVGLIGLVGLLLLSCGTPSDDPDVRPGSGGVAATEPVTGSTTVPSTPGWHRGTAYPLRARDPGVVVAVGKEVLVIGGATPPCPPWADCIVPDRWEHDGAAYDPTTDTWRMITPAPRGIATGSPHTVLDGVVYISADRRLLSYAVATDEWQDQPLPARTRWHQITNDGERLVLYSGSDEGGERADHVFDPATGAWSRLPADPLGATFDRLMVPTPAGLILTAKDLVESPGGADGPAFVLAARLDPATGAWTRLDDSDQLGGWRWAWTGTRLVDPTPRGSDGGRIDNFGRTIPYGGRLDPATGEWSRLPAGPQGSGGWRVEAIGGPLSALEGWIYDDPGGRWIRLVRPEGAPPTPGAAAWVGDALVVVGDWRADGTLVARTWVWRGDQ